MIISDRLAQLVRSRQPACGFWINLTDPGIAEIAAIAGYDWIMIDTEHNPITESEVQAMLYAVAGFPTTPVVRIRSNRDEHVKWVLDAGAGGIIVPSLRDAADAREAVAICKYHPLGRRGFGPNRASGFWSNADYVKTANERVLVVGQVELASAVNDVDAICEIAGLDAIWIGPGDLAQSLGYPERPDHPEVCAAIDRIIHAAIAHKMPWGIPTASAVDYQRYVARGAVLMTLGSDTRLLRAGTVSLVASVNTPPSK